MQQQFRIKEGGFEEIKKAILKRSLPVMIVSGAVGASIALLNGNSESFAIVIPLVIVLIGGAMWYSIFSAIKRQKQIYETYTITLTDTHITREQLNTPTVTININEIRDIVTGPTGWMTIKGKSASETIIVPPQLENFSSFQATLDRVRPLTVPYKDTLAKLTPVLSLLSLVLFVIFFVSNDKIVMGITGPLIIGILAWSLIQTQRNKNVDRRTKNGSWFILLVIASVIFMMVTRFLL